MTKKILFFIIWCVVLYFVGCTFVGAVAGGIASAQLEPGQDATAVGAAAGAKVVQANRLYIGLSAAFLAIWGSYFKLLPGFRVVRPVPLPSDLPRDMQRWATTREMGRSKYIWLYGVIAWGITTGLTWSLVMAAFQGWDRWPLLFVTGMVLFPIGGYFFGSGFWKTMEGKYKQALAKTGSSPQEIASRNN